MELEEILPDYACKCLNIRLYGQNPPDVSPPTLSSVSDFTVLYVGEIGIVVMHNEVTLRNRSPVVKDSTSETGFTQKISVSCLVCNSTVYRVNTSVMPEGDAKEGPVLPTEDWAERDLLRSKSGWVEVHVGLGGCIAGEDIERTSKSKFYSSSFSLVVPHPSTRFCAVSSVSSVTPTRFEIPETHSFLPPLPAFLPPPPFSPSHPVFLHIASVATASSDNARVKADKLIEEFAKQRLAELENLETKLKEDLDVLWRNVKDRIKKVENERDAYLLSPSARRGQSPGRARSSSLPRNGNFIREFVPSTYHGPRFVRGNAQHTPSALSASLSTSTMYRPARVDIEAHEERELLANAQTRSRQRRTPSPPPYDAMTSSSGSSQSSVEEALSRSLKRNMSKEQDVSVTLRYNAMQKLEAARQEQKSRSRKTKPKKVTNEVSAEQDQEKSVQRPASPAIVTSVANVDTKPPNPTSPAGKSDKSTKGQRKVTFNVNPNVVTIKRQITAEIEDDGDRRQDDLIFDIDESESETYVRPLKNSEKVSTQVNGKTSPEPVLQLREQPPEPPRRHPKDVAKIGLPQSFVALRPASLPVPSQIRPPLRSTSDSKPIPLPTTNSSAKMKHSSYDPRRANSQYEAELLRLVAAGTPSHRGAWKEDSKAWEMLKSGLPNSDTSATSEDEDATQVVDERDNQTAYQVWAPRVSTMASSLPIPIAPVSQKNFGDKRLQPKTSVPDHEGVLVPPLLPQITEEEDEGKPASLYRKQKYAERDRARARDPGLLDFAPDGDDEDEYESEEDETGPDGETVQISASRGRQHALKILKAGSSVPAEGLWRSLAT